MYGTAWRILRNPQEAEDVVQEAFLTLYRKAGDNPPQNLGAWLHRVTANRSLDRLRRRNRRAEVALVEASSQGVSAGASAVGGAEAAPAAAHGGATPTKGAGYSFGLDIERAIERLPERTRMVFVLHDVEGFKHREIGELMGITDGSSKSQLFRARAMLRDWLQPGGNR